MADTVRGDEPMRNKAVYRGRKFWNPLSQRRLTVKGKETLVSLAFLPFLSLCVSAFSPPLSLQAGYVLGQLCQVLRRSDIVLFSWPSHEWQKNLNVGNMWATCFPAQWLVWCSAGSSCQMWQRQLQVLKSWQMSGMHKGLPAQVSSAALITTGLWASVSWELPHRGLKG